MNDELSDEHIVELRRLHRQLKHPTPWSASIEYFPDQPLREEHTSPLVDVRVHQAGSDLVQDWDDDAVAEMYGRREAVYVAAAATWLPALLDQIEWFRAVERTIEADLTDLAAAARGLHDAVVEARLHVGVSYELSAACQEVADRTSREDGELFRRRLSSGGDDD